MGNCPFCKFENLPKLLENSSFYVVFDEYPVNEGHVLIISKKHIPDLFYLEPADVSVLYSILKEAKALLDSKFKAAGYNVGVNCGAAAGQTIFHFHVHVIPRYEKDVENPRGGIRNLKPSLVKY